MLRKLFTFEEQLKIGDTGEADFLKVYRGWDPKKIEKKHGADFETSMGSVELKTDVYDMNNTPNFFMERFTISKRKQMSGCPWRSKEHSVKYFVYYFLNNKTFFWFESDPLCVLLDSHIDKDNSYLMSIHNIDEFGERYEAQGYKINRNVLMPVLLKEHRYEA